MGRLARKGTSTGKICTLGTVLSILAPALATKSPDCGGILSPSGLSYLAEVSKQHAETILVQDLMAPRVSDLLLGSPKPISRKQIDSVKVVDLSLSLMPDDRLRLSIDADLRITTSPSTSKVVRLSILADLHVERNPEGNLELTASACKPIMEEMQSTEEMERSIPQFFFVQICLEVSKLLILPNERLASLTAQFPVTPSCQLQYLPLAAPMISEQGITVSLQTAFLVAGMALPLPISPTPFTMPEAASTSPSHLTLALSEHYYTSLFFAMERVGAFNMTISVTSPPATITPSGALLQMGSLFQEDLPVMLTVMFRSSPRVALEEGKATLKLFLTVHAGVGSSAFQNFLSMSVDMSAGLLLSVTDVKMMISAAVIDSSSIGKERQSTVLSEGIYLPHVSNFIYTDVNVIIHKDYVLIPCNLKLQPKTGGKLMVG
uniref:Lipid-binding serum glycoprotein C-terminal domain-containing protein n=1 Tax=Apteryx owenii TaxID=8824 RepID=A0A8B9P5T7_APTOW